jgi:RNA polymerase sigma-70 factor (ECF subfamily)
VVSAFPHGGDEGEAPSRHPSPAEPLDSLLQKLSSGDAAAAEQVFRTYEPYLRMVVRRRLSPELRAKFDSLDIVQSVWLHMLRRFREAGWRFADTAHLRAFLVQLTRHRFIDRLRRHRLALQREQPLTEAEGTESCSLDKPDPCEVLQAEELWEQMLELCPPAHQEILRLKREGALTSEVAARVGLHEGSVRRILHTLAQRLARRRESS